jgi:hypothetical protein
MAPIEVVQATEDGAEKLKRVSCEARRQRQRRAHCPKESIMKRTMKLLAMSVLMFGVQHAALSAGVVSPFPADAEASYDLAAIESYAERRARMGEDMSGWGVNKREERMDSFLEGSGLMGHGGFPSRGGPIDD